MQVWQHLDKSDHLRRRAEGMIDAARGYKVASAASYGHRPNTNTAHKLEMREGIQDTPGLVDLSSVGNK